MLVFIPILFSILEVKMIYLFVKKPKLLMHVLVLIELGIIVSLVFYVLCFFNVITKEVAVNREIFYISLNLFVVSSLELFVKKIYDEMS